MGATKRTARRGDSPPASPPTPDASVRLARHLYEAMRAAIELEEASLARVLWAIMQSDDFAWLDERKGVRALSLKRLRDLGQSTEPLGAPSRHELAEALMAAPSGRAPKDADAFATYVLVTLRLAHAELSLGPPRGSWDDVREAMVAACRKVAAREAPTERQREHYVIACLKAWGLSPTDARATLKPWL